MNFASFVYVLNYVCTPIMRFNMFTVCVHGFLYKRMSCQSLSERFYGPFVVIISLLGGKVLGVKEGRILRIMYFF